MSQILACDVVIVNSSISIQLPFQVRIVVQKLRFLFRSLNICCMKKQHKCTCSATKYKSQPAVQRYLEATLSYKRFRQAIAHSRVATSASQIKKNVYLYTTDCYIGLDTVNVALNMHISWKYKEQTYIRKKNKGIICLHKSKYRHNVFKL